MGAWGLGPWDNDHAADWGGEFLHLDLEDGLEEVQGVIEIVAGGQYDGRGQAAVWLVAMLLGWDAPKTNYGRSGPSWARRNRGVDIDDELRSSAARACELYLGRILEGEEYEEGTLNEIWDDDHGQESANILYEMWSFLINLESS